VLFSSPVFLFLFLPAVLLLTCVGPLRLKNLVLLAASLVFYAYGEPLFVVLMLASILVNWSLALAIERARGAPAQRALMTVTVVANLAPLVFFKYGPFLRESAQALLGASSGQLLPTAPGVQLLMPAGISFYTFQAMSYVIDVHRGTVPAQRNPLHFALYLTFFPQLIAGPIVRYVDVSAQITRRSRSLPEFALGVRRFAVGLAKKLVVADGLAQVADGVFDAQAPQLSTGAAWLGLLAFALQVYYDFSGYSDMASGLGRMFGITFLENFHYPYAATSCAEFWRRWHISLSTWFRDYVYIPLGGNRLGPVRQEINLAITFLLAGLWHGGRWTFALWGAWHAAAFLIERRLAARIAWRPPRVLGLAITLAIFVLSMALFRCETVGQALQLGRSLFGGGAGLLPASLWLNPWIVMLLVAGGIGSFPVVPWLAGRLRRLSPAGAAAFEVGACIATLLLLAISLVEVANFTYQPFLYFRF
jgi:alginate O-acetyltransferase complex protein AlgI